MIITDSFSTSLLPEHVLNYTIIFPPSCSSCLFWLHGYRERAADILTASNLTAMAYQYQTAVVIPDLPDTYYFDQPWNHCYTEQCFIHEFLPYVQRKYSLPKTPAHTFIAGASMGGFGSLLLGSRYPDIFGKIASISGAFILDDLIIGNPEVIGSPNNFTHFQNLFGDIPSLDECKNRNPFVAAIHAIHNTKMPPIFMTCGKYDMLYSRNLNLYNRLNNLGADITWIDAEGEHNWICFNGVLNNLFQWLCTPH